jgi:hypothetical protein
MSRTIPTADLKKCQYDQVLTSATAIAATACYVILLLSIFSGALIVFSIENQPLREASMAKVAVAMIAVIFMVSLSTIVYLGRRVSQLATDLRDTGNLFAELGISGQSVTRQALTSRAIKLQELFDKQGQLLEIDDGDIFDVDKVDRAELAKLRDNISDGKSSFWRLRDTAARWGLVSVETISIKSYALLSLEREPAPEATSVEVTAALAGGDTFGHAKRGTSA